MPQKMTAKRKDDDRFDYNKDPVAWFYQNQIRSEEEFQAKKTALREQARERLDVIFEQKGKHLIVDSEDDDFSINSSELSAWDSEVHSIQTLASCANSWAESANFTAPAMVTLRAVLVCTMVAAVHSMWQSLQAMLHVNRFWGVIEFGWVPLVSLVTAFITAIAGFVYYYMTDSKSKKGLLGAQIAMHVLAGGCSLLAMLCWVYPSRIDSEEQITLTIASIMKANAGIAVLALAATVAGSWHMWELTFVEKKASKHKRRRRQRKNSIPWDKIKVEDMGPISYCGGAPPKQAARKASATGATTDIKKKV
ncbi:hypothetical protein COO60DRAFT_1633780 [Scenedesmus sp. NREL 46B-D3]|nr:hypothetical protein COO60DRAFT_1633780 [Scenedesmus sp. NREL 46B-D3]